MASEEQYLFLYEYSVEGQQKGQTCIWYGYFRNFQEMEFFTLFYHAPHIKPIRIIECKRGATWHGLYMPHKRSEWEKLHKESFWRDNFSQDHNTIDS